MLTRLTCILISYIYLFSTGEKYNNNIMMRELYSQAYIDSECTIPYDAKTRVDNTVGTWATNFAIAVVGIIVTYKLIRKCHPSLPLFFAFTSVGYIIAGIGHIIVQSTEDPFKKPVEIVSYIFVGLGATFIFHYGLKIICVTERVCQVASLLVAIIALYAAMTKMILVGVLNIVSTCLPKSTIRKKWFHV